MCVTELGACTICTCTCTSHQGKLYDERNPFYTQDGDTAVHNACTGGHTDAVEELIAAYADLSIKNKVCMYIHYVWYLCMYAVHHTFTVCIYTCSTTSSPACVLYY